MQFLSERMKIEQVKKLLTNLHDKNECVIHIRNLKQAFNHGFIWRKKKVIKFNQDGWPKPYIDVNTKLRLKVKNNFKKYFFKLISNVVFGKTMDNVRKQY